MKNIGSDILKNKIIRACLAIIAIILIIIGIIFLLTKKQSRLGSSHDIAKEKEEEKIMDIFKDYGVKAKEKLQTLSLEEKIGQIFLVRYPETNQAEILQEYKFGGYLFFEKDFKNKTEEEIKRNIANLQTVVNIPLLIAVDEEGGKVVRVSSNTNLRTEKFKSPRELYKEGGFDKIREDTIEKSNFLYNLGINLNLAPVIDVTTNTKDYMYARSLGEGEKLTSEYAKTVIFASKEGKVSYTLKHFPGYGNNVDTHKESSVDYKSYEEIRNTDLPPFEAGIQAGAEAVLISHNIVTSIDGENPASLSSKVIDVLRKELGFRGVIITDDLYMGAVSEDADAVVKAVLAGNDLIIVTDYEKSVQDVKNALESGRITEERINTMAEKVLAWKYYKGMM